jgi:hypothetical protein
MANPDRPNGFKPASPIMCPRPYKVLVANATKIFKGDMMDVVNTGGVVPATAGSAIHIGSTDDVLAVSTAGSVVVYDDPDQDYIAQDDGSGTPVRTDIFTNVNHVAGTGNANTNMSGHEIGLVNGHCWHGWVHASRIAGRSRIRFQCHGCF